MTNDPNTLTDGNPDGISAMSFETTLSTKTVSVGSQIDIEYNPDELVEDNSEPSGVFTSGTEKVKAFDGADVMQITEKIEIGNENNYIQWNEAKQRLEIIVNGQEKAAF